jgi:hypothetical protein
MYAPNWDWIIVANILLGINQGLTWSITVTMHEMQWQPFQKTDIPDF